MRAVISNPSTAEPGGLPARRRELRRATAALEHVLPAVVELVGSVARPDAVATGEWRIADVVAHLSHLSAGELFMAGLVGQPLGPGLDVGDDFVAGVTRFNEDTLQRDNESSLARLGHRIEKNVSEFLAVMAGARGDEQVAWVGGIVIPSSCLACHLLGELLIHGYDIALAEGRRWVVEPEHAALGFGFFLDVLRFCPPSMRPFFANPEKVSELEACVDFRMRGGRRDYIVFEDGGVRVEAPSSRPVDCHVSTDPRIAMLAGFGRIGLARAAVSGRMLAWGRKPLLAFKLPSLIRNP